MECVQTTNGRVWRIKGAEKRGMECVQATDGRVWRIKSAGKRGWSVVVFGLMIAYIALFSALLSRLTALACGAT